MKTWLQKKLAILLAVCMVFSVCSVTAAAEEHDALHEEVDLLNSTGAEAAGDTGATTVGSILPPGSSPVNIRWDTYYWEGVESVKTGWLTFDAAEGENHNVDFYKENGEEDIHLFSTTTFCYPGDTSVSVNLFARDQVNPVLTGEYYAVITPLGDNLTTGEGAPVQSPLWSYTRPEPVLTVSEPQWDETNKAATWTNGFSDDLVVERYWVQYYCNPTEDSVADAEYVAGMNYLPSDEPPYAIPEHILVTGGSGWYYFRIKAWSDDVTKAVSGDYTNLSSGIYLDAPAPFLSVANPRWGEGMTMTWDDTSRKPEAVDRYWVQFLFNPDEDNADDAYSLRYCNYYADKAPHIINEATLEKGGSGWYYFRVQARSTNSVAVPDSSWSEMSAGIYYAEPSTIEPAATPTDILWGVRRWQEGDYEEVPGMLSFDAKPGESYIMDFYRRETAGDVLVFSYDVTCDEEDIYCTQNLFAYYTQLDRVTTGTYYCVITPMGDGVYTNEGEPAVSEDWYYVRPDNILTVSDPQWGEDYAVCWTNGFTDASALDYYRAEFYFNAKEDDPDNAEKVDFSIYRTGDEPFTAPEELFADNGTGWYYFCVRTRSEDPTKALGTGYTELSDALYYKDNITYTAELDASELTVSDTAQTVVMTVTADQTMVLDSIGMTVVFPEGIELSAIRNAELGFTSGHYNLTNGKVSYVTDNCENCEADTVVEVAFTIPANTPAGTYELGIEDLCISKNYGEVWEENARAFVTLTILPDDGTGGSTTGGNTTGGTIEPAATPTDILWGVRRWQEGDYEEVPGMLSFDAKPGESYIMDFYRRETAGDVLVFSYDVTCDEEDIYCTQNLFASIGQLDRITTGTYYCIITPMGDEVNTGKGEAATSADWYYVRPDNILTVSDPQWGENCAVSWTNGFTDASALDYYRANFYFNAKEDDPENAEYVDFSIFRTGMEPYAAPAELFKENGTGWYYFCVRTRSEDPTKALGTGYTELSDALYYKDGVTYTAKLDVSELTVSDTAQTVVMTVTADQTMVLDGMEMTVVWPEGIELSAIRNDELGFTSAHYNLDKGIISYFTADVEDREATTVVEVTFTIPANTPAGTYELGIEDLCIYKDYGTEVWEENASVFVTLTIQPDSETGGSTTGGSTTGGTGHSDITEFVYDYLSKEILKVAEGEITQPIFSVPMEELGLSGSWTAADLGVENLIDGSNIAQVAADALYAKLNCDDDLLINKLVVEHPYDLYWFDVSKGYQVSYPSCTSNGQTISFEEGGCLTFSFAVSQEYAQKVNEASYNPYQIDPEAREAFRVDEALAAAAQIVADNADKSDYDKLLAYKNAICSAVTYNQGVVDNPDVPYGNPWQMVYVFDGDETTNVVCEGYAKAFQYLCDQTDFAGDVKCYIVTGEMSGGTGAGAHMWNLVVMPDGESYLVDVTNCDEGSIGAPAWLFLAGADDTVEEGVEYSVVIPEHEMNGMIAEGGVITYTYDPILLEVWGENILELADKDYRVADIPESGTVGDFDYTSDANGAIITKYHGTAETVTVPATINGLPVYTLGERAFYNNDTMKELIISEGVQSLPVGNPALVSCSALEIIRLPSTLTIRGGFAGADYFIDNCLSVKEIIVAEGNPNYKTEDGVLFSKDGTRLIYSPPKLEMTTYAVPEGVVYISADAFNSNSTLKKVTLPSTIKTIGYWAFCASALEEINFPEGLESIGQYAFWGSNLKSINLPSTLTNIMMPAFSPALETIQVNTDNPRYFARDNVLFSTYVSNPDEESLTCLEFYAGGQTTKAYAIPEDVVDIAWYAFFGAEYLEEITLNEQITSIPRCCFDGCVSLKYMIFPKNIESVDEYAFSNVPLSWVYIANDDIQMAEGLFQQSNNTIIFARRDSNGQLYAEQYNLPFALILLSNDHTPGEMKIDKRVEPSCFTPGSYELVLCCTDCSARLGVAVITVPAKGAHGELIVKEEDRIEATCVNDGSAYYVYYCSVCLEERGRIPGIIPAIGHVNGAAVEENRVEPTCTESGSYDIVVYCTVCDAELSRDTMDLQATGIHTPGEAVEENRVEPTCVTNGSYDSVVYCSGCKAELSRTAMVLAATSIHTPAEAVEENRVEATCVADGSYDSVVYCSGCKAELSRTAMVLAATGIHTPAEAVEENRVEATCVTNGSYDSVVYCSGCKVELSRTAMVLAATGIHTPAEAVEENRVEATCVTDGSYDSVKYCTTCDAELSRTEMQIPAYGHTLGEQVIENEVLPTCAMEGSYEAVVYCATCDEELERTLMIHPATENHIPGEAVQENIVEPTATVDGYYDSVVYCVDCKAELSRETMIIPATGLPEDAFTISGRVTACDGNRPGEAITIQLQQGSRTVVQTETNDYGMYRLNDVPAGVYNLVATQSDGRNIVRLVEITADDVMDIIQLPKNNVSTQVTVTQGSPAIVVGGLDAEGEDSASDDTPVKVAMTLEQKTDLTDDTDLSEEDQQLQETQEAIKAELSDEADRTVLFLEIQVEKAQEMVSETINLLEIRIPYETHGRQEFQVLRHHDGEIDMLTEETNDYGEHIKICDGYIVIYARRFSLYAITSLAEGDVHIHNWEQPRYRWTADGCQIQQECVGCDEQQSAPVSFTVEDGKIKLSQVPEGLSILVCAYENDRMIDSRLLTNLQEENRFDLTGEDVRVFFLGSRGQPLMKPITID